jgi:hypothetical protein
MSSFISPEYSAMMPRPLCIMSVAPRIIKILFDFCTVVTTSLAARPEEMKTSTRCGETIVDTVDSFTKQDLFDYVKIN